MGVEQLKKAEYVEEQKEREPVNVGEPAVTGLRETGGMERKDVCEDAKINDPEKGLFLVADGVSTAAGWLASRELAVAANESLGESLDRDLENISDSDQDVAKKHKMFVKHIKNKFQEAISNTHEALKRKGEENPDIKGAATTASLTKIVESPNGKQYLFMKNLGDSRVYIQRKGELIQVSKDNSFVQDALDSGMITQEDFDAIDQATDPDSLTDQQRFFYQRRNVITGFVSGKSMPKDMQVKHIGLEPGDRLLITSDGVHDQMTKREANQMLSRYEDDRQSEKLIQQRADVIARDGKSKRAKADDIAAVVHTVGENGPDRSYTKENKESAQSESQEGAQAEKLDSPTEQRKVDGWRAALATIERKIDQLKEMLTSNHGVAPSERIALQQEINTAEQGEANHRYWIGRRSREIIESEIPPRFTTSDKVRIVFDGKIAQTPWTVSAFDPESDQYLVVDAAGTSIEHVKRLEL